MAEAKKRPAKMANRNHGQQTSIKDDGVKYVAVDASGQRFYKGPGTPLAEAVRLALGMVAPAGVARVESDGTLTLGRVDLEAGVFIAPGEALAA